MKKIMTLAAMFAAVAMTFSACNKEQKPDNGGNENGGGTTTNTCPDCGEDPCVCEPEYESPISIDGDFADWDALDPSKVAVTECAAEAKDPALKVLKVYADEVYINLYFEYDETALTNGTAAFDIYLNQDADLGGADDEHWLSQANVDYLLEDESIIVDGTWESFDPGMFHYTGPVDTWDWSWEEIMSSGSGIASGAGNGNKYELAVMIEMLMGVELADTFSLGCILTDIDAAGAWNGVGCIPNTDVTDDNPTGSVNFLEVKADK